MNPPPEQPGGVLVFVPERALLEKLREDVTWRITNLPQVARAMAGWARMHVGLASCGMSRAILPS